VVKYSARSYETGAHKHQDEAGKRSTTNKQAKKESGEKAKEENKKTSGVMVGNKRKHSEEKKAEK
jgi:hypothetical protein